MYGGSKFLRCQVKGAAPIMSRSLNSAISRLITVIKSGYPPMKSKHTDEQLGWLRSHLQEYETRAGGNVRGDAKKFALEMAGKYIDKWGVPDGEKENTMKEVRLVVIIDNDVNES